MTYRIIHSVRLFICSVLFLFSIVFTLKASEVNSKTDSLKTLVKSASDDTNKVNALINLATEYQGSYPDSAIFFARQAVEVAKKCLISGKYLVWEIGLGKSFNTIAISYYRKGDYPVSLQHYFKALGIWDQLERKAKSEASGLSLSYIMNFKAKSLGNIGLIYWSQSNYSLALKYYFMALKIDEELGNKKGIARHLGNIGVIYAQEASQPSRRVNSEDLINNSLYYLKRALVLFEEQGNKRAIATVMGNMGNAYLAVEDYQKAMEYNLQALKMREELGAKDLISSSYGNIATVLYKTKKYDEAESWLKKALIMSDEIEDLAGLMEWEQTYYQMDSARGNFKSSLDHYKKYVVLRDSISNQENIKKQTQVEMQFEFDRKEAETKADTERREAEAKAEAKRQQVILWSVVIGLLLVSGFSVYVVKSLRTNKRMMQIISRQKLEVEEKQKEILDSIRYARRIQTALLPTGKYIERQKERLKQGVFHSSGSDEKDFFIFYKPKDIVSGDFYYALAHQHPSESNELFYIATADCTGHGVPGAFMSMLGVSALNESIIEKHVVMPDEILNDIRNSIIASLNPEGSEEESKDGMDCVLCAYDFKNKMLYAAAANNPFWIIRKKEVLEYKPDKMPVGKFGDELKPFTLHAIPLEKGDVVYSFTDGYADQFGGPKGKKFKYKQLEALLLENHQLPMEEQQKKLFEVFESWKGPLEQVDDVLVIGMRI